MEIRPHLSLKDIKSVASKAARVTAAAALALTMPKVALSDGGFTPDPSRVVRTYTQCGGKGYVDNETVFVQQVRNPEGFKSVSLGIIAGQCGNRYTEPDSFIQDLAQVQYQQAHGKPVALGTSGGRTYYYTKTFSQCGGSIGPMDINPAYTVIIDEFTESGTGEHKYSWRTVGRQPNQCGNP